MTPEELRTRVVAVCASPPFGWHAAVTPFSFDLLPSGSVDQAYRVEVEMVNSIGGMNYTEERTDRVTVWVARKHRGTPEAAYELLLGDVQDLRAAIVRDGIEISGAYSVPDSGGTWTIERVVGQEFAVGRLTIPVTYETTL